MHMTMAAAQAQGCGSAAVSDPEPTTVTPRACAVYAVPTKTCAGTRVNTRGPMAIAAPLVPPLRARVVVVVHGGGAGTDVLPACAGVGAAVAVLQSQVSSRGAARRLDSPLGPHPRHRPPPPVPRPQGVPPRLHYPPPLPPPRSPPLAMPP
jgi:hypothetical protein